MLWNRIPSQLAKENKKFIYGLVREGGRAKDYETALMWLIDCGLVHKVIPLEVKAEENLRAKSLRTYQEKYTPELCVRTSMADYKRQSWLVNLPLYAIEEIGN